MTELKNLEEKLNSNLNRTSTVRFASWSIFIFFWIFSLWTIVQQTTWLHNIQIFTYISLNYYLVFFGLLASYVIIFPIAKYADKRRITSNIILESENEEQERILEYCNIINKRLITTKKCLLVDSSKSAYYKYSAGASELLDTTQFRYKTNSAYRISSKTAHYSLETDSLQITLIGSVVLVFNWRSRKFSAHQSIHLYGSLERFHFIWDEKIPADSQILEYQWKYTNKNGKPDQRFKDNYQVPILLFWSFELETNDGIIQILLSDSSIGKDVTNVMESLKEEWVQIKPQT
ncbi:hypothetical protein [Leptospira ellisii]|nr:hypothetical protein [Leptospira ellisii]PKA04047.1 hypothetical protein CH375_13310 [Leptospira ellisii]